MPTFFSLAQHPALHEVQRAGEAIFAFLDDLYIICEPDRVSTLFELVREALFRHGENEAVEHGRHGAGGGPRHGDS